MHPPPTTHYHHSNSISAISQQIHLPYVRVTFVKEKFVLVTFVYVSNISVVICSIFTRLYRKFFRTICNRCQGILVLATFVHIESSGQKRIINRKYSVRNPNSLLTGIVQVNKELLTRTVLVNNLFHVLLENLYHFLGHPVHWIVFISGNDNSRPWLNSQFFSVFSDW